MAVLVDKNDALRIFDENCYPIIYDETSIERGMTITGIRQVLDEAMSVNKNIDETILRRHAYWKPEHHGGFSPGGNPLYRCSNCNWIFGTHMLHPNYRYCPECGSVMKSKAVLDSERAVNYEG